jgi:hypothetical protein
VLVGWQETKQMAYSITSPWQSASLPVMASTLAALEDELDTLGHALVLTREALAEDSANPDLLVALDVLQQQIQQTASALVALQAKSAAASGSMFDSDSDTDTHEQPRARHKSAVDQNAAVRQRFVPSGDESHTIATIQPQQAPHHVGAMASWECHTKAFGSRLLLSMGYCHVCSATVVVVVVVVASD